MRWHCPPNTGFEIRALAVWGRARYLPVTEVPPILSFTRGWGRNSFVSFKPPRPGTEPRTLAWKAAVLTTTIGPPPQVNKRSLDHRCALKTRPNRSCRWDSSIKIVWLFLMGTAQSSSLGQSEASAYHRSLAVSSTTISYSVYVNILRVCLRFKPHWMFQIYKYVIQGREELTSCSSLINSHLFPLLDVLDKLWISHLDSQSDVYRISSWRPVII